MSNITLKDGEVVCDRCGGNNGWWCPKCFGSGKLDWVENIVGKIGPVFHVHFDAVHFDAISCKSVDFPQAWRKEVADGIAKEIDKQILERIKESMNIKCSKFIWET